MVRKRVAYTYETTPQLDAILRDGFRKVADYDTYELYEKVVMGKVLYRECFHKFELYGASWANAPAPHRDGFHYITREKTRRGKKSRWA